MKRSHLLLFLLILVTSCSHKSDKELYEEGQAAQSKQEYQLAIERYQAVVEHSPASAYAETSQYNIAIIYNNDLHDTRSAISAYQKFYDTFSSSREAPNALFLIGFLYNNELKNIDSARMAYEKFLQNYPAHTLALSAKFELETLGRDPAQVLQSKGAASAATPVQPNAAKQ